MDKYKCVYNIKKYFYIIYQIKKAQILNMSRVKNIKEWMHGYPIYFSYYICL